MEQGEGRDDEEQGATGEVISEAENKGKDDISAASHQGEQCVDLEEAVSKSLAILWTDA